ncbi:MAG: ABC transporter permease subunit [Phycisphaerae bacterium]|nr:ABC transporter permease subunit [Phycisphaerae bacterium]
MQTWALIKDSFREAIDRKLFWVMLAISALIALSMAASGFDDRGMSILFGYMRWNSPDLAVTSPIHKQAVATILGHFIADHFLGWVGIGLAIIATAGTFPSLMERGTIEVIVSKPMRRWHLFLGKYLGGMVFVLVQASIFVLITFLVAGTRWKVWLWSYFWLIPLFVVLFSYLFCFTALFGVLTRSPLASLALTFVAWFLIWAPQATYGLLQAFPPRPEFNPVVRFTEAACSILPKTGDISFVAIKLTGARLPGDLLWRSDSQTEHDEFVENARQVDEESAEFSITRSIGSSLAFEAVIVLLAGWRFCRRDF